MKRPQFHDVPEARRRNMASIRSRDTKPELKMRCLLHALGYRFRLQPYRLPGCPDIILPSRRKVIFVHGCFWHWHKCHHSRLPIVRRKWWKTKLLRNMQRDAANATSLKAEGWSVLIIWECEMKETKPLSLRVQNFLGPPRSSAPRETSRFRAQSNLR
jgi:DNA mismatch endonuclease Vsr